MDNRKFQKKSNLSGSDWYNTEAIRAVNQAIGRVIRHKNDFGAIYFMDKRFSHGNVMSSLSDWARKGLKVSENLKDMLQETRNFFNEKQGFCKPSGSSKPLQPIKPGNVKRQAAKSEPQPVVKKAKKIIVSSRVQNVLKYKATNVVVTLKEKLSKEQMTSFKNALKAYKSNEGLEEFCQTMATIIKDNQLSSNDVQGLREFIRPEDVDKYDESLKKCF